MRSRRHDHGWTVEAFEADRRLRLSADLKLPGEGWLDFEVTPLEDQRSMIRQTATFDPRGWMGRGYWYALLPVHNLIFGDLLQRIARHASRGDRFLKRLPGRHTAAAWNGRTDAAGAREQLGVFPLIGLEWRF